MLRGRYKELNYIDKLLQEFVICLYESMKTAIIVASSDLSSHQCQPTSEKY